MLVNAPKSCFTRITQNMCTALLERVFVANFCTARRSQIAFLTSNLDFLDEVVVVFFRAFFFDENLRAIKVKKLLVQFLHFQ